MTSPAETAALDQQGGGPPRSGHGWRVVAALAVTQTIGYGVLYYAFSVFLAPMARDLHATPAQIAAALTLSVLIAALCAPLVGRLLDARGGRVLMTIGSLLGTVAVLAWSRVESLPQLYGVFALVGVACSLVLYEAAFAVIVSLYAGDERGRANGLLALTIVAGFASSIFLPLTGLLVDRYGWRTALVILALLYGLAAIPLHALVLRRARTARKQASAAAQERAAIVKAATRARPFWLLVIAFTVSGGAVATVAVLLITYLIHLGHPPVLAATLAGLLGVLSVTGRLITTGLQTRLPAALIAAAIFALQGVAALLLPLIGRSVAGAIGAVLLFGLGFGIASITLPHLLVGRYGTAAYASLAGRIAVFSVADKALAPLGALALAQAAGYGWVMGAVAAACAIAAFALVAYHRL
ncbi:major facilitator superfamily MFS_1 [[Actinomadura] parvosata subsp. kistnae]|uniref:MFS transporter n=1 Tax=[Actinomadura] parvosata subsp. kistnae TaxID=1909395 RepID=A0A1U9ZZ00_9ACTN|nr:MFS transporter [Nonomuraea sp. ATCC 55076]AQZ63183.1 MFS transporter [Nonomuraea sp. ATCC 55076]SPL98836.1 major facilitator superfamily MFS_1 [Actinomadura parvosata subsp. kistnae]